MALLDFLPIAPISFHTHKRKQRIDSALNLPHIMTHLLKTMSNKASHPESWTIGMNKMNIPGRRSPNLPTPVSKETGKWRLIHTSDRADIQRPQRKTSTSSARWGVVCETLCTKRHFMFCHSKWGEPKNVASETLILGQLSARPQESFLLLYCLLAKSTTSYKCPIPDINRSATHRSPTHTWNSNHDWISNKVLSPRVSVSQWKFFVEEQPTFRPTLAPWGSHGAIINVPCNGWTVSPATFKILLIHHFVMNLKKP